MKIEQKILNEINQFLLLTGISARKFGLDTVNDHKLVKRLQDGKEIYSGTINTIRSYIANYKSGSPPSLIKGESGDS